MGTLLKPLDTELLARLYHEDGLSTRQIGTRLGVGNKTVQRQMVNAGIARREPGSNGLEAAWAANGARRGRQPSRDQVLAAAREDLTLAEIAALTGSSPRRVSKILREEEAPFRRILPGRRADPELEAEIIAAAGADGAYVKKIARDCGTSREVVKRVLASAGITLPNGSGLWRPRAIRLPPLLLSDRASRILLALSVADTSTPQLLAMLGENIPGNHQRALTICGQVLRAQRTRGRVERAGRTPGGYQQGPAVIWRITDSGHAILREHQRRVSLRAAS